MQNELDRINPEGKYAGCDLRRVDRAAIAMLKALPYATLDRTRDVFQFTDRDEEGVIVVITPEAVEFRMPTTEWPHPHTPIPSSRLWKRVTLGKLVDKKLGEFSATKIQEFLDKAQQERSNEFRKCHFCGRAVPREHRHYIDGKHVCHGCSEQHLGIVH